MKILHTTVRISFLSLFSLTAVYADSSQVSQKAHNDIISSLLYRLSSPQALSRESQECKKEPSPINQLAKKVMTAFNTTTMPLVDVSTGEAGAVCQAVVQSDSSLPVENIPASQVQPLSIPQQSIDNTGKIVAHKAQYSITLEKNFGDDISDAAGEMTIRVFDTGDGYVFEQNSSLIVYNNDGEGEQIITDLATWENFEGTEYHFNARTLRNGEQEDVIKGKAYKDPVTQTAYVIYQLPNPIRISIPYESIFPLHHLLNALDVARRGGGDKGIITNTVFDGSSETYEAVSVDTLLGNMKDSYLTLNTGNPDIDKKVKYQWPMRLSVYPKGSQTLDPDYSMNQNVLGCGIIKDMTLDYGTFQMKATLEMDKVTLYDEKAPKF